MRKPVRHVLPWFLPAAVLLAACGSGQENAPAATTTVTAVTTLTDTVTPAPEPTGFDPNMTTGSTGGPNLMTPAVPMESPTTTDALAPTTGAATTPPVKASTVVVDGRTVDGFPAGLAFPGGSKIDVVTMGEVPNSGTVILRAPTEKTLMTHFRALLPRAGYGVTDDVGTSLAFTGQGFEGSLTGNGKGGGVFSWGPASR